jgi:hypothetical protein
MKINITATEAQDVVEALEKLRDGCKGDSYRELAYQKRLSELRQRFLSLGRSVNSSRLSQRNNLRLRLTSR